MFDYRSPSPKNQHSVSPKSDDILVKPEDLLPDQPLAPNPGFFLDSYDSVQFIQPDDIVGQSFESFYAGAPAEFDDGELGGLFLERLSFSDISGDAPGLSSPIQTKLLFSRMDEDSNTKSPSPFVYGPSDELHQCQTVTPDSLQESAFTPPSVSGSSVENTPKPSMKATYPSPGSLSKVDPLSTEDNGYLRTEEKENEICDKKTLNREKPLDPVQEYVKLIPIINRVNPYNVGTLLVAALRQCLDRVPLDDFYNLLFNADGPDNLVVIPEDGTKIEKSEATKYTPQALKLCYFILETFRLSDNGAGNFTAELVNNFLLLSMNVNEILRVFLALKVIFDSVHIEEEPSLSMTYLSRLSFYQAYYIICHKLIYKYPTRSNDLRLLENLVLGQSKFGKLAKLVFPNLVTKRLGKRGQSRYHYLGMKWNESLVDEELKRLAELEFPQLQKELHRMHGKTEQRRQPGVASISVGSELNHPKKKQTQLIHTALSSVKPKLYSFVDPSNRFPKGDCSPRVWQSVPGELPKQSQWSKDTVLNSVEALKLRKINVEPIIKTFNESMLSTTIGHSFVDEVILMMRLFLNISLDDDAYLHLYLIVILLLSPIILDSGQGETYDTKAQLRSALNGLVTRLESEFETLTSTDSNHLLNFTKILKRMIHMNKLFLTRVKVSLAKRIVKELVFDMYQNDEIQLDLSGGKTILGQIVIRAVVMATNAFKCKFINEGSETGATDDIILKLALAFMNLSILVTESGLKLPESMDADTSEEAMFDLPFRIFNILSGVFHGIFLSDPYVIQLPIQVISFILLQITNEMQKVSFHQFSRRDSELSKETFKIWWVYSMTVQEYNGLISEIVTLSCRLAGSKG